MSAGEDDGPSLSSVMELLDEQTVGGAGPDEESTHGLVMLAVDLHKVVGT